MANTGTLVRIDETWRVGEDRRDVGVEDFVNETHSAVCNDGTPYYVYENWPSSPDTDLPIVIAFSGGGFAYKVNSGTNFDCQNRASTQTSSDGLPDTKDLDTNPGGFMKSSGNFLANAAQGWVTYRSSDMFTGGGTTRFIDEGSSTEWQCNGFWNIRCAVKYFLNHPQAANYSKVLFVGLSAGGYGVLYNWKWLYDYSKSLGFEPYCAADGVAPYRATAYTGIDKWMEAENAAMANFWRHDLTAVEREYAMTAPYDIAAVVNRWSTAQRQRCILFTPQTDSAAIVFLNVVLSDGVSASEGQYGLYFSEIARQQIAEMKSGINVYSPHYVNLDPLELAHVLLKEGKYTTDVISGYTPEEALEDFLDGNAVFEVESSGTYPPP